MSQLVMYVDESGTASLSNTGRYFVLTGLIVEERTDLEVSSYFRHLKRRHELGIERSFHAYDILEDKFGQHYLKNNKKCKECTASIAEFIENAPFKIIVTAIDKKKLRKKLSAPDSFTFSGKQNRNSRDVAYEILARKLFFDFAKELKAKKASGAVVAESRREADQVLLSAYLASQTPSLFTRYNLDAEKLSKKAVARIHSICFAGKGSLKGGLEFADIVSYCAYNDLNGRFPKINSDWRGVKKMWSKIKKTTHKGTVHMVNPAEMSFLAQDRIDEISKDIKLQIQSSGAS